MDEVLAVGDANFQEKCYGVFEELKKAGEDDNFGLSCVGKYREVLRQSITLGQRKNVLYRPRE